MAVIVRQAISMCQDAFTVLSVCPGIQPRPCYIVLSSHATARYTDVCLPGPIEAPYEAGGEYAADGSAVGAATQL